jgi:small subunit ribosomal protein S6
MTNQPYYETMYILRPDIPEEEVDSHLTKYSELVTKSGAEVLDSQMRGKRRLAYPISKHKEGIYVQLSHNGNGQHVEILEKAMRLSEDVIRYLTVKQDGPLPTPRNANNTDSTKEEEVKDSKDTNDHKDTKENKENKDTKENKES